MEQKETKKYETPKIEVAAFEMEDILTNSSFSVQEKPDNNDGWGLWN